MVKELPHFKELQFLADDVTNFGDEVCILNDVLKSVIDSGDWRDEDGTETPEEYADIVLSDSILFANRRGYEILYIFSKTVMTI